MALTTEQRRLLFRYDAALPLDAAIGAVSEHDGVRVERFSFASTHDERVPAVLCRPADTRRLPLIVAGHGAGASKDEPVMTRLFAWLATQGFAVLAIDAPMHGERPQRLDDFRGILLQPYRGLHFVTQAVVDNMRAIDWAATRPDLDTACTGYLGLSMGSILGVPFVAMEPRVRGAVFALGGAGILHVLSGMAAPAVRADAERVAEALDPLHYGPLIAPRPVLMINGTRDQIIPAAAGHVLYNVLGEPRRVIWYDGGHGDIPCEAIGELRDFFVSALQVA